MAEPGGWRILVPSTGDGAGQESLVPSSRGVDSQRDVKKEELLGPSLGVRRPETPVE